MIEKPLYRKIKAAVGEAHGELAVFIVLKELEEIFESFAEEIEYLYDEDPENDNISLGYRFAAGWCNAWAAEIDKDHG